MDALAHATQVGVVASVRLTSVAPMMIAMAMEPLKTSIARMVAHVCVSLAGRVRVAMER